MGFADAVGKWAAETEQRLERVFQVAVTDLGEEMVRTKNNGGALPHLTGALMNSLLASTASMPTVRPSGDRFSGSNVGAVAATLKLGDTVWIGYQAAHARRQNYGFVGQDSLGRYYNQEGNHFAERAVGMWPQIVAAAAEKVRAGR